MPQQVVKEIEARFRANTSTYRQEIAQAGRLTDKLKEQIQQASATLSQAGTASGRQAGTIARSLSGAEKAAERISKTAQTLVGRERELSRAVDEQKRRLSDLSGEYQRVSDDVSRLNGVYDTIKEATKGLDLSTPLAKQREQVAAEMDRLENDIRTLQGNIAGAGKGELVPMGDGFIGMDEAKAKLQELIAASDQAAERFQQLDAAARAIGEENLGYASNAGLKQLQTEISGSQSKLSQLEQQAGQTESRLASYSERLEDVRRGQEELGESTERLSEHVSRLGESASASPIGGIGEKLRSAGEAISAGVTTRLKEAAQGFLGLGSSARSGGNGVLSSALTMAKAMIGVRSLYMLIRRLKSAFSSGIKELANYSGEVKTSLGSMSAAMSQMQNSIATAFAPLVTTVAPYVTAFIRHIADAFNAVGAFFASLTGQSSYTRAVYNYQGVAGAADKAAGSTKKAADAQKELNRQLMGFDQINKLNDNDSGSGSGGSGGGGSGGDSGGNGLSFVTESIPGLMSDWAEKFKEAWANADFTEIGGIIGQKLRDALDNIPWDDIKDGARRVAKSLATLLNGFIETEGLSASIGRTVAEAFNTGFEFVNTFLESFHFDSFGRFITSGIQAALETFEWSQIGRTVSNLLTAALDFGQGALDGVRWDDLGGTIWAALKDTITNIDYAKISEKFFKLLGTAIQDSRNLIGGFFGSIAADITDWATDDTGKVDFEKIAKAYWGGLKKALEVAKPASDFLSDLNIPNPLTDIVKTWESVDLVGALLEPLKKDKTWKEFGESLKNAFSNPFDVAVKSARAIVEGFSDWLKDIKFNWDPLNGDFGIKLPEKSLEMYVVARAKSLALDDKNVGVDAESKRIGVADRGVTVDANSKDVDVRNKGVNVDANSKNVDVKNKSVGVKAAAKAVSVSNKVVNKIKAVAPKVHVKNNVVYVQARYSGRKPGDTRARAKGGVYQHGRWSDIPQYAGGTLNAGSMFVAGEAGPEVVGHVGGRTEVLNKSQLASTMYSAVVSAVGQYKDYFSRMASNISRIPQAVGQLTVQAPGPVVTGRTARLSASAGYADNAPAAENIARQVAALVGTQSSSSQPIVVKVELDGRVIAESSVREWRRQARSGRFPLSHLV